MFESMCLAVRRAGMVAAVTGLMFYTAIAQAKPADSADAEEATADGPNEPPGGWPTPQPAPRTS